MDGTRVVWSRAGIFHTVAYCLLFMHGLEEVTKKSKFLYALGLSTDISKKVCPCRRTYSGPSIEVRDNEPLLFHREE